MPSFMNIFCLVLLVSINGLADAARVIKVGDELGWHEPEDKDPHFYTQWAERNRFRVGDSLLFEYQNDSVVEVEKWGYYHCNTTGSIVYFNNGKSSINLDRSGLFFFISGAPNHCKNGQRLIVDVMGLHRQRSNSPPAIANPPESSYLAPSPQSTVNQGSGSAAAAAAATVSAGVVSVFSVVLAIIVTFVGSA